MTATAFGSVVRGVAMGDAWGDPIEFQSIENILRDTPEGAGYPLPAKLRITDDTQMTLFLADALDLTRDDDVADVKKAIMDAFLSYYKDPDTGSRAPGSTVMGSLGVLWRNGYDWQKATNRGSDGSGTIMRTSSTAFLPEDRWVGVTAFASAVTHGPANSMAAAIIQAKLIRDLVAGSIMTDQVTQRAYDLASDPEKYGLLDVGQWLEGYEVPGGLKSGFDEIARLLTHALADLPNLIEHPWDLGPDSDPSHAKWFDTYNGAGWRAHHTLVCAVMAVDMFPGDPWSALQRAATSDGDSDTIGAVAGALLGAAHPQFFADKWDEIRGRFEPRYQRWIEQEADDYLFTPDAPEVIDGEVVVAQDVAEVEETKPQAAEVIETVTPKKKAFKNRLAAK